jgi:hypothetical protein
LKESSNFDKNASDGIPEPVSQGEHRAQTEADRRMEEISSSIKRICEEAIRDAPTSGRDLSRQEEIEAEHFALENGLWIPFKNVDDFGEPYPGGNENIVYYNQIESAVYKVNNLINAGSITKLIAQILLHNKIFPDTPYELVGFTGFEGRSIYPVLKQSHIDISSFATPEDIADYMHSLGFNQLSDSKFADEKYTVSDLFPRNVLKDRQGNIYVIDDIIKENHIPSFNILSQARKTEP